MRLLWVQVPARLLAHDNSEQNRMGRPDTERDDSIMAAGIRDGHGGQLSMFWTEHGERADERRATPMIEPAENAGPEDAAGRSEALDAMGQGIREAAQECADIAGRDGATGPLDEWREFIDATERAGGEPAAVEKARERLTATYKQFPPGESSVTEATEAAWDFFGSLGAVAGLAGATQEHMRVVLDTAEPTERRRAHALGAQTTVANLADQMDRMPTAVPSRVPGTTNRSRRLMNSVRRQGEAARQRFDEAAEARLDAIGLGASRLIESRSDHARVCRETAVEMFRNSHGFAIAGLPAPGETTLIVYWHEANVLAKTAQEPYRQGFDAEWAEIHGQTMLAMAAGRTQDGPGLDPETRMSIAHAGALTMAKAEAGLHDLEGPAVEQVVRTIELAEDYRRERSEILADMAGGRDILHGWLSRTVGARRSSVTPTQARAMIAAGRENLTPEPILRQLAGRMGQSSLLESERPEVGWGDVQEAIRRVGNLGAGHRLERTIARGMGLRNEDPRLGKQINGSGD